MVRHCELCNVYLPSDSSVELHEKGKNHVQYLKEKNEREKLAKCSVFMYGFPAHIFQSEDEIYNAINHNFGPVSRVILDFVKGTFAIVEFNSETPAQNMIEARKIIINGHTISIKERRVNFEKKSQKMVAEIDVDVILAAISTVDDISTQLDVLVSEICLSSEEVENRRKIAVEFGSYLAEFLPENSKFRLFGSSTTGLGFKNSDLDLTLLIGPSSLTRKKSMETPETRSKFRLMTSEMRELTGVMRIKMQELAKLTDADRIRFLSKAINHARKTKKAPISQQTTVLDAKCPLIKLVFWREKRIDLTIDNRLGVNNSHWLSSFVQSDSSQNLRHFLVLLRFWALSCDIFDRDATNCLNNYILTLMGVTFLQIRRLLPPIENDKTEITIQNWRIDFLSSKIDFSFVNVVDLFRNFLTFYAMENFENQIICPKMGKLLTIDEFRGQFLQSNIENTFKIGVLNVQDPFELTHNTAGHVAGKNLSHFRRNLMVTISKMKKSTNLASFLRSEQSTSIIRKNDDDFSVPISANTVTNCEDLVTRETKRLLTEILGFRESFEPVQKRRKAEIDEKKCRFDVEYKLWQGRRVKRREIVRDKPNLNDFQTELAVSELLLGENPEKSGQIMSIFVNFDHQDDHTNVEFRLIEGIEHEFHVLGHFLATFLPSLVPKMVQDNIVDSMEE